MRNIRLGAQKDLPVVVLIASLLMSCAGHAGHRCFDMKDHDYEHDLPLPALGLHIGVLRYLEPTMLQ